MDFSTTLKELREEKGLTQKELAKACNLSPQCISALEKGINSPTAITLTAISKFFNIPISELLGDEFNYEELSTGITDTKKVRISPIEEELLKLFRQIKKKHGEKGQKAFLNLAEIMLDIDKK